MVVNSPQTIKYDAQGYACLTVFLILTTIAIVARGVSRRMIKAPFGADDAFAFLAYVANTASLINAFVAISFGRFDLSRVLRYSPKEAQSSFNRNLASAVLYIPIIVFAKFSILFLFRRVFHVYTGRTWFGFFWWFNFILVFPCWSGTTLGLLIYLQTGLTVLQSPAKNLVGTWGIAACSFINVLSDIMVLALPIRAVIQLQLDRGRKIGTIAVFSMGFLTTLVSLARASLSFHQATHTVPWNPAYKSYNTMILSHAETSAACICACLVVTRPFFMKSVELALRSMHGSSIRSLFSRTMSSPRSSKEASRNTTPRDGNNHNNGAYHTVGVDTNVAPLNEFSELSPHVHGPM